jgi:ABC-type transport system involved in cytochrome bd biosynthesis fused ATPase/permease subunit
VRLPLVVPHIHQQQLRTRMANPAASDLTTMEMVGSVLALLIGLGGAVLIVLLFVGGLAVLRRFEARPQVLSKKMRAELDELRLRLAHLERGEQDLGQMEERLAFVEQLLDEDEPRTPPPPGCEGER